MVTDFATADRPDTRPGSLQIATIAALARAGFRRYATYRQATIAAAFTNSIFGFLRCYVLLAAAAATANGVVAGYSPEQLATYCWASQGLLGLVMLWGWTDLSDRIRTGDVVSDLLRPVHPVISYLAIDVGRAGHALLTRMVVPMVVGSIFFDLFWPQKLITYPLFILSAALAVVVCFAGRYLLNATGFWLLDTRGVNIVWAVGTNVFAGLAFPLHFLPTPVAVTLWVATPFPSMLQAPLDVLLERHAPATTMAILVGQAAWAGALLALCASVQRRAERKLVIQGG